MVQHTTVSLLCVYTTLITLIKQTHELTGIASTDGGAYNPASIGLLPALLLIDANQYSPNSPGNDLHLPHSFGRDIPVVQYIISCNPSFNSNSPWVNDDSVAKKIAVGNKCATYIQDNTIQVTTLGYNKKYVSISDGVKRVNLIRAPITQQWEGNEILAPKSELNFSIPSECCDEKQCPSTCIDTTVNNKNCFLYMYTLAKKTESDIVGFGTVQLGKTQTVLDLMFKIPCHFCSRKSCIEECSNGEYATGYTNYDKYGLQASNVTCIPCAPGTWNTCIYLETCKWKIPSTPADRTLGSNIRSIGEGPVGSCYACFAAQNFIEHYVDSNARVLLNPSKPWKCPGGTKPPENCPTNDFRQSSDGANCVCKPGFYESDKNSCTKCPKAHKCPDGVLVKCPMHYYQPEEGQTECRRCVDSASDSGFYSECPVSGQQLKFCDPNVPGTQDRELFTQCIPCNQCMRPYAASTEASQSRCYRDR